MSKAKNAGIVGLMFFPDIHYGEYLASKFFLVTVAFLVLGYWLTKNPKTLKSLKPNLIYFVFIGLSLLLARFFTFDGWFFHDDFRLLTGIFTNASEITYPQYPVGILYLITNWFGGNYHLYNALGLLWYLSNGAMIFAIGNVLQKKKYVSCLASIFFVTTPTYFQEKLLIGNFVGDGFLMLLFLLSLFLLLRNFLIGSIIFAAAALEFGIARTQFIAAPLVLTGLFFLPKILTQKSKLLLLFLFPFISLAYLPVFLSHHSITQNKYDLNHVISLAQIFGDMLSTITIPFAFNYSIVYGLAHLFNKWPYITILLGYIVIFIILFLSIIFYLKKKILAAKLLFLGLVIIVTATLPAVIAGVRVDRAVDKFVEYNLSSIIGGSYQGPRSATAYGFFPSIGLALIILGIGTLIKPKPYKIIIAGVIIINIASYIYSDWNWAEYWGRHNQKMVAQLERILPKQDKPLYIYISLRQRFLWQGIRDFQHIYRATTPIMPLLGVKEFTEEILKSNPSPNQLYFLVEDWNYNIYDYSQNIRIIPKEQLSFDDLTKSLTSLDIKLLSKHYSQ